MQSISSKLTAVLTCDWLSIALSYCTICTWSFLVNESLFVAVTSASAWETLLFTRIFGSSLEELCSPAGEQSG
jgi:hypothetical protein